MRKWYVGSLFISLFLLTITGCKVVDNAVKGTLGKAKPTPTPPSQAPGGGGGGSSTFALGQPDTNTNIHIKQGFSYPFGFSKAGTKFFIADYNNNRVLGYNSVPVDSSAVPDFVLGQPHIHINTANNGGISAQTLFRPMSICSDGTKLVVADGSNNRVLIWNSIPSSTQVAADVVVGQPDMTSNTANNGGLNAQGLNGPQSIICVNGKLFVADTSNNRILIWNAIPTVNQQAADLVLGQANMTSGGAGTTSQTLNLPDNLASDGTRLLVTEWSNNRALMWNTIPTVNQQAADIVLGQPNMTSAASGLTAATMNSPRGVAISGTRIYVNDSGNKRTLVWTSIPVADGTAADLVLGQPNFTSNTCNNGGISAQSMCWNDTDVEVFDGKLYVADGTNHRILIWNSPPTVNQQAADAIMGHLGFTIGGGNNWGPTAQTMKIPCTIHSDGTRLVVPDYNQNRILIWNTLPTSNQQPADVVLGQPNFTSNTANNGGISAQTMWGPDGATIVGSKLIVSEYNNHRVLIWNSIPTSNQQAADIVLGQPNMTSNTSNNGGLSSQTLSGPNTVYSDGTRLLVLDYLNNRVLIWNTIPTVNQQPADLVLGQPNMTSNTVNNGGVSAQSMSQPAFAFISGTKLYISDYTNHRVLIWNTIPTVNQQPADLVLGQPNMTSNTVNNGGISAQSLNQPGGMFVANSKLYLPDVLNNRILIWNTIPTVNQQAADIVLGQPNFTSNIANNGGLSAQTFSFPYSLYINATQMFVGDYANHRIVVTPIP